MKEIPGADIRMRTVEKTGEGIGLIIQIQADTGTVPYRAFHRPVDPSLLPLS